MEVYFGQRSFDPGMHRQGTIQWIVHAGLVRAAPPRRRRLFSLGLLPATAADGACALQVAHAWADQLQGMCVGEVRRLILPPSATYGDWKDKAVYLDFELIKVDDEGFKEWEESERREILTNFYQQYDPSKGAAKVEELLTKAGVEKFPKLCRQLYAKYNTHPVTMWLDEKEAKGDL